MNAEGDRPSAFTLVELLLVLGILAALSALVFASLAPSREKGRESVCFSNLHQLGRAFDMYRADYDGREAAIGVPMTGSDLGLPPPSAIQEFRSQYNLTDSPVQFCPSYRPSRREASLPSKRLSSYVYQFGGNDFPEWIAKRGNDYALVLCNYHNPSIEFSTLPSWTPFRCVQLRLNGQVTVKSKTVLDLGGYEW